MAKKSTKKYAMKIIEKKKVRYTNESIMTGNLLAKQKK
jgi:hypothetical protein